MFFDTEAFQLFQTLFHNVIVYIKRPNVLWQVGIGFLILAVSGVLQKGVYQLASSRLPLQIEEATGWQHLVKLWINELWEWITRPIIALILLAIVMRIRANQNALTGLLTEFASIVFVYLLLRTLIATLYTVGEKMAVRRFNAQFLWPLFALFVVWRVMSRLISVQTLLDSELVALFGSPVTVLGALIATIGLYLWVTGVNFFDDAAIGLLSRRREEVGSVRATVSLVRYLLIIVGVGIAISQLNFNATTIAAITGGLSVGVGFALSTILSNFLSGLILLFERSIQPGDVIEVDDNLSIVEDVSMRAMRVRTLNNIEMMIPNQTFVASSFTTFTGSDKRIRVQLPVGASYDDEPDAVRSVLLEIAMKHPRVLRKPAPKVHLVSFGDSSVNYFLNVWLASPLHRPDTVSELNMTVFEAFAEHGFSIPFPQQDLHIISGGGEESADMFPPE